MEKELLKKLRKISSDIYRAENRSALFEAVGNGCALLGFDHFILSRHAPTTRDFVIHATLTSFTQDNRPEDDRPNGEGDDIRADQAPLGSRAFFWDGGDGNDAEPYQQSYIAFFKAHHMKMGGVALLGRELNEPNWFGMASSTGISVLRVAAQAAAVLGEFAKAKADMLGLNSAIPMDAAIALHALKPLQRDILNWIAEGKSNLDIATILHLSERSIRYHVSEILRKLCVASRSQAASIALAGKGLSSG